MMTLEQIRYALSDRRLMIVAEATGLHYNTVKDIAKRHTVNPSYAAVKAISDYLEGRKNDY